MKNQTLCVVLSATIVSFASLSCDHPPGDPPPGTGTMSVILNGVYYDLTNVQGQEYLGFHCYGMIEGHKLSLAIGGNPQTDDTLRLTGQYATAFIPAYLAYDGEPALQDSPMIAITWRAGQSVAGTFKGDIDTAQHLFRFTDGKFNVQFNPSD